jgi:hypothetical protein
METDLIGPVLTNFVWDDRISELATGEKQSEEWSVELQVPPPPRTAPETCPVSTGGRDETCPVCTGGGGVAMLTLHPLSLSFPYTSRLFELLIPIL